jgi:KilA-N domain.
MSEKITVSGIDISVKNINRNDYISLTDIAKYKTEEPSLVIGHWMRTRNAIDYLTIWETLYNPNFNPAEIGGFKSDSSLNTFTLSPQKWVFSTDAIGIISKSGKYGGGTFAHKDIAFKFAGWISVEFELYIYKEFQRLKEQEQKLIGWSAKRELAKINYKIHTDAIKENIIPPELTSKECSVIYADEADILNKALFHMTAKEWRLINPDAEGNIRDYAAIEQLLVLANLESLNAEFIRMEISSAERLKKLNFAAINQMKSLLNNAEIERLQNWSEQSLFESAKIKKAREII